jgi:transposase
MLDQTTRSAILRLREEGHGTRAIARALGVSRGAVKDVLEHGRAEVPRAERTEKAAPHRDEILDLFVRCKGNLVRVHEELARGGAMLSYQALTAFCRRHGIGHEPKKPAGQYHFEPGQEMQHDTSPHDVKLGGRLRRVQTASLVLCHSRMLFFQHYPHFRRFDCKVFLTEALRAFGGACGVCMIDNTHVVVLSGTGRQMVPVPEMAAFADRFRFTFHAHEKGDANRSARVERPFDYIENNFHAGREFTDWDHLNQEARAWCDKVNAKHRKHLHASPRELFAVEQPHLKTLPIWIPEVYALHQRILDIEGFEVRETKDAIEIFDGPRQLAAHMKVIDAVAARVWLKEHRPPRGEGTTARGCPAEEEELLRAVPELADYLVRLKKHAPTRGIRDVRRLARMVHDYPRRPLLAALASAAEYGLYDLERVERMLLRSLTRDFFRVPENDPDDRDPEDPDDR